MKHRIPCQLLLAGLLVAGAFPVRATPSLGSWNPLFQGIDHAVGTNLPAGNMPNAHVVHVLRVDLTDPDLRLFSSPRLENYVLNAAETGGYTVTDFLKRHQLQVAVNAGLFTPQEYYLPAGTPMDIGGLAICEGIVVSEQEGPDNAATLAFSETNEPRIIAANWPAASTAGMWTAVSGSYPLLVNGVNLGAQYLNDRDFIHRTNPRTVMGFSRDPRRLYIVVIDGRQPGYSTGANDYESAAWLQFLGATDGVNLDGGGSSTLVVEDSTGQPRRLNRSSAVADSGRERTVGAHFGIYAKPVRGFLNDIAVEADDTFATVRWTTVAPATGSVAYGLDAVLGEKAEELAAAGTEHQVLLTGLSPSTRYYFRAQATEGGILHEAPVRTFVTTNHVQTIPLFGVDQVWRYAFQNLEGVPWTQPGYKDGDWAGSGPGLLWTDARGGARAGVEPAATAIPLDSGGTGFPYPTYYFRTRFEFPADPAGVSLRLTTYVDDGAVFYLNGAEIHRLRMDAAPAAIGYASLASGFGCSGDATCGELVELKVQDGVPLQRGTNVLAVEVHNYNARSPDTTFGMALEAAVPVVIRPVLELQREGSMLTLRWKRSGFALQRSASPAGPWTDVEGPVVSSPHAVSATGTAVFYRLRGL